MSRSQVNADSAALDRLVELGRSQGAVYSTAELDAGLETVMERLGAERVRRQALRRAVSFAGAILAAGITAVVAARWLVAPPTLTYEVRGGVVLDAGYLRGNGGSGVVLTFQEGTTFELAPGARARLRSVDAQGARLGLENGKASFDVTPDATRRWEVEVGPFLVRVKGTSFDLAWDPEVEQFELDLEHGKVSVSGPISGGELTLHGGQRLVVHLAKGETRITELRGPSPDAPPLEDGTGDSSEAMTGASHGATSPLGPGIDTHGNSERIEATLEHVPSPGPVAEPARPETGVVSGKLDWVTAMARGQWTAIVRDAEQHGLPSVLATASAEELFTLANAARYRKRSALARDALSALRTRFAGSSRAVESAFLLGRVAESRGEVDTALSWYDEYLTRAPRGTYAAEALGRKMTMVSRSLGTAKALPVANEYLRRYPQGSYAGAARALLSSP